MAERFCRANFKEIAPCDSRVVRFHCDVARGEVERSEVRCEKGYVCAENLREAFVVAKLGIEPVLAMIRADKKAAGAARRIENAVFPAPDTKGIDEIDEFFVGVVLTEFVAFLRRDEALENRAENVAVDRGEIEGTQIVENGNPRIARVFVGKNQWPCPIAAFGFWIENSFIVAGKVDGFLKPLGEQRVKLLAGCVTRQALREIFCGRIRRR